MTCINQERFHALTVARVSLWRKGALNSAFFLQIKGIIRGTFNGGKYKELWGCQDPLQLKNLWALWSQSDMCFEGCITLPETRVCWPCWCLFGAPSRCDAWMNLQLVTGVREEVLEFLPWMPRNVIQKCELKFHLFKEEREQVAKVLMKGMVVMEAMVTCTKRDVEWAYKPIHVDMKPCSESLVVRHAWHKTAHGTRVYSQKSFDK